MASRKVQDINVWKGSASTALDNGALKHSALTLRLEASGKEGSPSACSRPVNVVHRGAKPKGFMSTQHFSSSDNPTYALDMQVRCRQCPGCLRARAAVWRHRMIHEIAMAQRTWFGTLTLNPQNRFQVVSAARLRLARGGTDFDRLTKEEQFTETVREVNKHITSYVKRIRKQSGASLRLIVVTEPHKDGFPHWHLLIHEREGSTTGRILERQWKLGFAHWRLVAQDTADKQAWYVAKYIAKEARTRIRASLNYGNA